jgi:hypothetical protein
MNSAIARIVSVLVVSSAVGASTLAGPLPGPISRPASRGTRLGLRSIDEITRRIAALGGDVDGTMRAERRQLEVERDAHKVVARLLGRLAEVGGYADVTVAQFAVTADVRTDFADEPGASVATMEAAYMFTFPGGPGTIYLNANTDLFRKVAAGDDAWTTFGATVVVHELTHVRGAAYGRGTEADAYRQQLTVIDRFGPDGFRSKRFFKKIRDLVEQRLRAS